MAGIVYDARRVKAYEGLISLGEYAGESTEWCDQLWKELINYPDLFEEFVFYLENHSLADKVNCRGYSITDLYVWQLNRYNIIGDWAKNSADCNKERMVLHAFSDMCAMIKNPEAYVKKLTDGRGMDK